MEDNDLTVTLKDGRGVPRYHPSVLQQDFSFMDDSKVPISTAEGKDRKTGEGECEISSEMFKDIYYANEAENVYLLYSTRSGFHISVEGTLIFLMPP